MAYLCRDCSYRSSTRFPAGKCPACNSYNVAGEGKAGENRRERTPHEKKTLVEYVILALFWGFLLWGIWDRYLK